MDQHTYVTSVYAYYAENYYEPGNPEDGEWDECHYPVPACKGGTLKILLLKQHHAVQGLLQSEEYDYPCIFGWERKYLPKEYLPLFKKWRSKLASIANKSQSAEIKRKGWEGMMETITPEKKQKAMIKTTETLLSQNPDHFKDMGRKAREMESQETRSARGHMIPAEAKDKGRALTNSRKFRCTVTGYVATAGILSIYQKRKGIDKSNREQVQ